MINFNKNRLFDLLTVGSFFDLEICRELINEMRRCQPVQAIVYGMNEAGSVDERVRKVSRILPSKETVEYVKEQLIVCKDEIGEHFGIALNDCEEPQFLHYRVGDFLSRIRTATRE